MQFSKKRPLKIEIIEQNNDNVRNIHIDAHNKIKMYKNLMKENTSMPKELKEEVILEIQKYRARLKLNKRSKKKLKLKYKDAEFITQFSNQTNAKELIQYSKDKLKNLLITKRKLAKRVAKDYKTIDGVTYELSGGVHSKKNTIHDLFRQVAMKRVNSPRKPEANANHVGIEIEFFSNYDRDNICNRLIDAKLSKNCRIMTDGSIRPTENKRIGLELCIVAPESEIDVIIRRVCDVLADIEAETNESCGLHIHLDARNRDKELLFYNLVQCQDLMFDMTKPSRKTNKYCVKQKSPDWDKVSTSSYQSHYDAINKAAYNKHKTIEVRIHHGTVNYNEINNWIKLLTKIANYNEKLEKIDKVNSLKSKLKVDTDLLTYVEEKVRLFSA